MDQLELNWPKIGDTVECDACHGKGWYSMSPATDNENYNDRYQTDHNCHNCRRTGKLVVVGFSKHGIETEAPESDWVYGEDGDYS